MKDDFDIGQPNAENDAPLEHGHDGNVSSETTDLGFLSEQFGIDINQKFFFGDLKILEWADSGGQSKVFRALDIELNRQVAIKYYHSAHDEGQIERVLAEGRALAQINHPNVATCHSVGTSAGAPYLVLEWVDGSTLDRYLEQHEATINEGQWRKLLAQIAAGVAAFHKKGLMHGDLKPTNVIVTSEGIPKIIDLGLTQNIDQIEHQMAGTYAYMAPEVARDERQDVGVVTDVFGLGGILYYMLTGKPVYQADNKSDTKLMAIEAQVIPPTKIAGDVPKDLENICLACLSEDPKKRPQNVREILQWLGPASNTTYRRETLTVTLLAGAVLATLIGLGIIFNWFQPKNAIPTEITKIANSVSGLDEDEKERVIGALEHLHKCHRLMQETQDKGSEIFANALAEAELAFDNIDFVTRGKSLHEIDETVLESRHTILQRILELKVKSGLSSNLESLVDEIVELTTFLYGPADKKYCNAMRQKAAILMGSGRFDEAMPILETLLRDFADSEDKILRQTMYLKALTERLEYKKSIEFWESNQDLPAPKDRFNYEMSRTNIATAYWETGETDKAQNELDKTIEWFWNYSQQPRNGASDANDLENRDFAKLRLAKSQMQKARYESEQGSHAAAIGLSRSAVDLISEVQVHSLSGALIALGRAQLEAGRLEDARVSIAEARIAFDRTKNSMSTSDKHANSGACSLLEGKIELSENNTKAAVSNLHNAVESLSQMNPWLNRNLYGAQVNLTYALVESVEQGGISSEDAERRIDEIRQQFANAIASETHDGKRKVLAGYLEELEKHAARLNSQ